MKENDGWVYLLNQQLAKEKRPYKIINASISGETTAGGLARLPGLLDNNAMNGNTDHKIDKILIELGANDGLRGFPPSLIKQNLLHTIELAQAKNIQVLLMQIKIPPNYGPRYTKMFEGLYSEISNDNQAITLLPFFMEEIVTWGHEGNGQSELMQSDGLHPNKSAQPLIADMVRGELEAIIK